MTAATARRRGKARRRGGQHPAAVVVGLAVAVALAVLILHVLGWLLATGAIAAGAFLAGRDRRPATRPVVSGRVAALEAHREQLGRQVADLEAQRDRLARQADDLRGQLERQADTHRAECAALNDAIHAAWDAAANARPATSSSLHAAADDVSPAVAAMLADPLSGVRRLGPDR